METDSDAVADLGHATIQRIEALLGELNALDAAWKLRMQVLTRLERRELPEFIPGWHDFVVSIRGLVRSIQRLLQDRTVFKKQTSLEADDMAFEEQDRKASTLSCSFES